MAVRRESVRLELEDAFSRGMLTAAAATKTLEGALRNLDGTSVGTSRSISQATKENDRLSTSAVRGASSIDKLSGRLGILLKVAAVLGPALVPLGAVGIAGIAGLANQFGFAAVAAGTAIAAFQGVGDALKAVDAAALDPSVANLEKAHEALKAISPAAQAMVAQLQEMRPVLQGLRDTAATAMFPGVIDGLESLERLAPSLTPILTNVGDALGDIFAAGADSLTSSRWADFFHVLASQARPVLMDMASAIGSVVHGLSEMTEAFMPLNRDFGSWLADGARGFDKWATGLSQTEGFAEFVDYIRENGPKLAEATTAIANAFLQIVEASAPLAGPVLEALTSIANVIATIADSPLGTPIMAAVTAMSALSLATNVATAATVRLKAAQSTLGVGPKAAPATAAPAVAGAGAKGGAVVAAGVLGVTMGVTLMDNFVQVLQGDRGFEEAGDVVATWSNPATAALKIFGVDVYGADKKLEPFIENVYKGARAQIDLEAATSTTRAEVRRFGNTFFGANKEMLRTARTSERLQKAIGEEKKAARESATAWTDYSQKVKLAGPSLDELMRRWRRLGEAAADMGDNMRLAIKKGVDPALIQNLIDTLGPVGAAGAIRELANASKETRVKAMADFLLMTGGANNYRQALRRAQEAISGNIAALENLDEQNPTPTVDLDDKPFKGKGKRVRSDLEYFNHYNAIPTADLDTGPFRAGFDAVMGWLAGMNRGVSHSTAYLTTVHRDIYQQLRGNGIDTTPAIAAGGTVPGKRMPYGDKTLAWLAPGEEVISNRDGQADRHRALLKAINAGMANGGTHRASERSMGAGRGGMNLAVSLGDLRVSGTLETPWGPAEVRGIARAEASDVVDQRETFRKTQR